MSNYNEKSAEKIEGFDVSNVTFDANGEVAGLSDEALDSLSGGLMSEGNNGCANVLAKCG